MAMGRLLRVLLTVVFVGGGLTVTSGRPAVAECTRLDPWPSFTEAVPSAKTVFVGTVTDTPELGFPNNRFTLTVDEILRGDPPAVIDFGGFKSGVPLTICPGDSVLRVREKGERLAFAMDARLPGVEGRIDAVAFVDDSKPDRFMLPKMEQLPLTKVRRLAGHAADGSTVKPPPYTPTGWPPDGLVTEEVGPGVLRVLSDGYRELSPDRQYDDIFVHWGAFAATHDNRHVAAAPDGAVWIIEDGRMFRIGRKKSDWLTGQPSVRATDHVDVAPDGAVWRIATPRFALPTLSSLTDKKWKRHKPKEQFCAIGVQPDGVVWATWSRPSGADPEGCPPDTLGRWNGKRWTTVQTPKLFSSYGQQFAVTGNDEVWLCCKDKGWDERQRLVRFNGRKFRVVEDPAPQTARPEAPLLIDGSTDGTLWMRRSPTTLARHDDDGWTVFTSDADGVPQMGWIPEDTGGFLRAASDGSVWVSVTTDRGPPPDDWPPACNGVAHFDGTTWTQYLEGMCVFAMDVAPDGKAWVQASLPDTGTSAEPVRGEPVEPIQTFVIDPQAVESAPEMSSPLPSPSE